MPACGSHIFWTHSESCDHNSLNRDEGVMVFRLWFLVWYHIIKLSFTRLEHYNDTCHVLTIKFNNHLRVIVWYIFLEKCRRVLGVMDSSISAARWTEACRSDAGRMDNAGRKVDVWSSCHRTPSSMLGFEARSGEDAALGRPITQVMRKKWWILERATCPGDFVAWCVWATSYK